VAGFVLSVSHPIFSPPKFTSKERDSETGLDYFEARYMSSAQGRFTSPDPGNAGSFASDPQSWNGYAYVRNNPLKYRDPHGLAYTVCQTDSDGKQSNCGDVASDMAFTDYLKSSGLHLVSGNNIVDNNGTKVGTADYYDADVFASNSLGAQRIVGGAGPVVNTLAGATLGFIGGAGATGIVAAASLPADAATLIPGLAPIREYKYLISGLDSLGQTNPGANLSPNQARALAENVVDVLRVTAAAAATKGGPYVESLRRQLQLPRFQFLDQIPGPLKEAIVNAAANVGISIK
jgi:RHS repeat-associated protein